MTAEPSPAALQAFRLILESVPAGHSFSLNTIRDLTSAAGLGGASLGVLFVKAQQQGWIRRVGSEMSTEPAAKCRQVAVYRREAMHRKAAA